MGDGKGKPANLRGSKAEEIITSPANLLLCVPGRTILGTQMYPLAGSPTELYNSLMSRTVTFLLF